LPMTADHARLYLELDIHHQPAPASTLFPYTTLFRSHRDKELLSVKDGVLALEREKTDLLDRVAELEKQHAEIARTNDALRDDKEAAVKRADDWKRKAERHKRSEEHTSELQSRENLVCRLLLEK